MHFYLQKKCINAPFATLIKYAQVAQFDRLTKLQTPIKFNGPHVIIIHTHAELLLS